MALAIVITSYTKATDRNEAYTSVRKVRNSKSERTRVLTQHWFFAIYAPFFRRDLADARFDRIHGNSELLTSSYAVISRIDATK